MLKKIILFFLFILILTAGISLGFTCGRGKASFFSGIKILSDICFSSGGQTALIYQSASEETRKLFASFSNYQSGISETYKNFPLLPGITEKNVWTFLKPVEGILYTASTTSSEAVDFYRQKLAEAGWIESEAGEFLSLISLKFGKASSDKDLFLDIINLPPKDLPRELNLKQQTYVSIHFLKK